MPKQNPYLIENKKPIELVQEIEKYEIKKSPLSKAARVKVINKSGSNYVSDSKEDYGPCRNSLCGCSCSSSTCNCSRAEICARKEADFKVGSYLAMGRAKDGKASGEVSSSVFRIEDSNKEARFFSSSAGGEVGKGGVKAKLGFDVANVKSDGVQVRAGLNVDSGISTNEGLEVKALGLGFSVNDEQVEFSTPIGGVKVDNDKCLLQ